MELLLKERSSNTPVLLARQLGRPEELLSIFTLGTLPIDKVDMLTVLLIGNSSTYINKGHLITPRGYQKVR